MRRLQGETLRFCRERGWSLACSAMIPFTLSSTSSITTMPVRAAVGRARWLLRVCARGERPAVRAQRRVRWRGAWRRKERKGCREGLRGRCQGCHRAAVAGTHSASAHKRVWERRREASTCVIGALNAPAEATSAAIVRR